MSRTSRIATNGDKLPNKFLHWLYWVSMPTIAVICLLIAAGAGAVQLVALRDHGLGPGLWMPLGWVALWGSIALVALRLTETNAYDRFTQYYRTVHDSTVVAKRRYPFKRFYLKLEGTTLEGKQRTNLRRVTQEEWEAMDPGDHISKLYGLRAKQLSDSINERLRLLSSLEKVPSDTL